MTRDEFANVMALVKASWPHGSSEDLSRGYWEYLGELEARAVVDAVRDLALAGREFPPPPGVVHAAVHHGADAKPAVVAARRAKNRAVRQVPAPLPIAVRSRRARDLTRPVIKPRAIASPPTDTLNS